MPIRLCSTVTRPAPKREKHQRRSTFQRCGVFVSSLVGARGFEATVPCRKMSRDVVFSMGYPRCARRVATQGDTSATRFATGVAKHRCTKVCLRKSGLQWLGKGDLNAKWATRACTKWRKRCGIASRGYVTTCHREAFRHGLRHGRDGTRDTEPRACGQTVPGSWV